MEDMMDAMRDQIQEMAEEGDVEDEKIEQMIENFSQDEEVAKELKGMILDG